jgi:hypothetical protein
VRREPANWPQSSTNNSFRITRSAGGLTAPMAPRLSGNHAFDGIGKATAKSSAPVLAVGEDIDAGLPLHLQGIQDCRILEVPQLLRTHPTRRISRATLQQFRRTQQASQLIRAIMHGSHPVIFLSHFLVDFRSI